MKMQNYNKGVACCLALFLLAFSVGCKTEGDKKASSAISDSGSSASETESLTGSGTETESSSEQTSSATSQNQVNSLKPDKNKASGKKYYVSSSSGNDANSGTSESKPWKTAKKLSSVKFAAGDQIYFQKGDQFDVAFSLNMSGKNGNPIVISSYGKGSKPVLKGDGITLKNAGGIVVSGLDFWGCSKGIWVNATGKVENAISIDNCDFHDGITGKQPVFSSGKISFSNDYGFQGSGIVLTSLTEKGLQNLFVENCNFYNLTVGMAVLPITGKTLPTIKKITPTVTGLQVSNCDFRGITGEAALFITQAEKVQINDSTLAETGFFSESKLDSAGLRIAGCKEVAVKKTTISSTYAYAGSSNGAGILLEGVNNGVSFTECTIKNNIGPAFLAKKEGSFSGGLSQASFRNCTFSDNNTARKNGNVAVFSESGQDISISGGVILLHNDEQKYNNNIKLDGSVNVCNASGKALQGSVPANTSFSTVKVGVAKAKITPEERTFLWGYTNPGDNLSNYSYCNPATDILDDTWVKVIAFEDSKTKKRIIFIIGDMCLLTEGDHVPAGTFARWAKKGGISTQQLIVSTTHDHQGTGTLLEKYIARVDQAIVKAVSGMQPVKMGVTATSDDIAVSRRPNLAINKKIAFDNSMLLLQFTSVKTGNLVTCLTNIAIHNTSLGNGNTENLKYNTSELTGNAMAYIEKQKGSGFVSVFMNGAYGDAGPDVYDEYGTDYNLIVKRSEEFGKKIIKMLENTPTTTAVGVNSSYEATKVQYRPGEVIQLVGARVGNVGFFGVSGEIFSAIGASIKAQSPFDYTITTANTNAFYSYMPTYDAIHDGKGGYGVSSANHYRDDIESVVTQGALRVLNKISDKKGTKLEIQSVKGALSTQSAAPSAFDGKTDTAWQTSTIEGGWIQCDLGASKNVTDVALNFGNYNRLDAAWKYDILISDGKDFSNYRVYASADKNTACQQNYRRSGLKGRYVRFVLRGNNPGTNVTKIYEMSVYGN